MSGPENLKVSCLPGALVICAGGWNGLLKYSNLALAGFGGRSP